MCGCGEGIPIYTVREINTPLGDTRVYAPPFPYALCPAPTLTAARTVRVHARCLPVRFFFSRHSPHCKLAPICRSHDLGACARLAVGRAESPGRVVFRHVQEQTFLTDARVRLMSRPCFAPAWALLPRGCRQCIVLARPLLSWRRTSYGLSGAYDDVYSR